MSKIDTDSNKTMLCKEMEFDAFYNLLQVASDGKVTAWVDDGDIVQFELDGKASYLGECVSYIEKMLCEECGYEAVAVKKVSARDEETIIVNFTATAKEGN